MTEDFGHFIFSQLTYCTSICSANTPRSHLHRIFNEWAGQRSSTFKLNPATEQVSRSGYHGDVHR